MDQGCHKILQKRLEMATSKKVKHYTCWSLSNLVRGEIIHQTQSSVLQAFVKLLLEENDVDLLKEAVHTVSDLINDHNVASLVDVCLVPRLKTFLE